MITVTGCLVSPPKQKSSSIAFSLEFYQPLNRQNVRYVFGTVGGPFHR